jgi:polyisoprenoid-binding protein YceI
MVPFVRSVPLGLLLLTLVRLAPAEIITFKTIANDKRNLVQFVSQATLESFTGRTSDISGQITLNLDSLPSATGDSFTVDLTTMDTGIKMRNNDMRTKFLETAKYPTARFVLTRFVSTDKISLQSGESAVVVAEGQFTCHGVSKTYQIPITLRYLAPSPETANRLNGGHGALLIAHASWKVKLSDHNIQTPQLLFMRVAPEQDVTVDFAMTDQ